MDILLVGPAGAALYHNEHGRAFRDVSAATGFDRLKGSWMGCACGDIDGDGFIDVLLTGFHRQALLRNVGGRRFDDITRAAGLELDNRGKWGLSAGFMALTQGGPLDLVITNYVGVDSHDREYCEIKPGIKSGCPPTYYRSEYPEVWRNMGGRFLDVTRKSGLTGLHGYSMTVAFADFAGTGRADFYVGNDGRPAEMIRNLGNMRFRNVGGESGAAVNNMGHAIAAMGADWGDYDRDGRPDLAISAFSDEPYSLLHNRGRGLFEYASDQTNLMGPTYTSLGFGVKWLDMDNDGWPDVAFANGHVYDNADQLYPGTTFRQPIMLFHNRAGMQGRQMVDIVPSMQGTIRRPILGRGLASGDFDNDGRVDLLVVDYEGTPLLLHNESGPANHWITFDLRGRKPNFFAYGATITAESSEFKGVWTAMVSPAGSFLSSSDPRVHFGLGTVSKLDKVEIRWPDGSQSLLRNVPANQILRVSEVVPKGGAIHTSGANSRGNVESKATLLRVH